jgi:hypothetical protein
MTPPNQNLVRQELPEVRRKRQYSRDFVFAVISAFIAVGWPEVRLIAQDSIWHSVIGWILWGVAVAFIEHILWIYWESIHRSLRWRIVGTTVISVAFVGTASYSTYIDWKQQMASALEGDLIGAGPALIDGNQHGFPDLRIGGTTMIMAPNGVPERFIFFSRRQSKN